MIPLAVIFISLLLGETQFGLLLVVLYLFF